MAEAGAAEVPAGALPELVNVRWRRRRTPATLRQVGRQWTTWTVSLSVPFVASAGFLMLLEPLSFPVALMALIHAWCIPWLYANRGAMVVRPRPQFVSGDPERVAQGLLGDLLGHDARALQRATGLVLERGRLGAWLVGEEGALLVAPGGRRVHSVCVRVVDPALPPSDRIAHLLLALRTDEGGFATVGNVVFSGAPWRVSRRMNRAARPALRAARAAAAALQEPTRWS